MTLYRFFARYGGRALVRALVRMEVAGAENVPTTGPCILAPNHESIADPFMLGAATERPIHYMAKRELFAIAPVAWAMRGFGAFPVERGGGDRGAISQATALLAGGEVLGIFPQGTSKLRTPRRWHRGAAKLALATGATLVPVRVQGTRRLLRLRLPRVRIEFLPAIEFEPGPVTIAAARELTAQLEHTVSDSAYAESRPRVAG
ncbi:MAG TPA: lysophospholipid acyltransferase family protein [Gaiellaceae bacterium]